MFRFIQKYIRIFTRLFISLTEEEIYVFASCRTALSVEIASVCSRGPLVRAALDSMIVTTAVSTVFRQCVVKSTNGPMSRDVPLNQSKT